MQTCSKGFCRAVKLIHHQMTLILVFELFISSSRQLRIACTCDASNTTAFGTPSSNVAKNCVEKKPCVQYYQLDIPNWLLLTGGCWSYKNLSFDSNTMVAVDDWTLFMAGYNSGLKYISLNQAFIDSLVKLILGKSITIIAVIWYAS